MASVWIFEIPSASQTSARHESDFVTVYNDGPDCMVFELEFDRQRLVLSGACLSFMV